MATSDAQLANLMWHSLTTKHSPYAIGGDLARRYPPDIGPFTSVIANEQAAFDALTGLVSSGEVVDITGGHPPLGEAWTLRHQLMLVQLVYNGSAIEREQTDSMITRLMTADIPAMLALVELTHPGPFRQRTIELGPYLGIWQDGQLVAMAGLRFHVPGYREISAVCTHPSFQRRGYARMLLKQLISDIQNVGEVPFLHVASEKTGAYTLYESLGFKQRTEFPLYILQRQ